MSMASISDAERERRRQLAIELHKQGKFGGPQPGSGRPRKKRVSELIAEKAQTEADRIWAVFLESLDPGTPASVRLQAAKDIIAIEQKEAELKMREDKALEEASKNELIDIVLQGFSELIDRGYNPIIDSEVVDDDPPEEIEAA